MWDHCRSEGPPNGIFCPWVRGLEWAWTPEETSSAAAAAAVTRGGGGAKTKSFVFRRMWTNSGRRLRHFEPPDCPRLFPEQKKINVFSIFSPPGPARASPAPAGGPESGIRKSKNPKIQDFGPKSMKFGFDRLCQGPKINFLPFGTSKNPQNPRKSKKK